MAYKPDSVETHESYGMVGFARITSSGGGVSLFGSELQHPTSIRMRVCRAEKVRDLNRNRYHANDQIVEVELSPNQFVDLITTMNMGDGVPCTLRYIGGKRMEDPPVTDIRKTFEDEFKKDMHDIVAKAVNLAEQVESLFEQKTFKAAEREGIRKLAASIVQDLQCNMPFVHSQFIEAIDDVVTEGKSSLQCHVDHMIHSYGLEKMKDVIEGVVANVPALEAKGESNA